MTNNERRQTARGAQLRLSVPPDPRLGAYVRHELLAFAEANGVRDAEVADFMAAIGEALANAIEHAHTLEPIEVSAWLLDDRLFAAVRDRGVGFPVNERSLAKSLPDAFAERGRGLPIMQSYADVCTVRSAPGEGTRVTLGLHVNRNSAAAHTHNFQRCAG
jgi:anti-sigma regulatory factor (Ser/Thr protein kinase)